MGQTKVMKEHEKWLKRKKLREEGDTGIDVLTEKMKEEAGMNHRYVRDFSGGTSGLKKIKIESKKK